jgi:glycosyltransferase involved in cell wall biosynthesis
MGYTENKDVLDFYTQNSVNLFISLSAAEGIPVSIMEAISFGIPVLSTDVGGCSEIVNENTGLLIPLNTSCKEVANLLFEFKNSTKNTPQFRQNVREFWINNFDEIKNYSELISEINKIAQ